jgi:phage antirepressor YoqD-like protein
MSDTPTTIAPKDLAAELGIDPKRLRGWLRANHARVAEAKNTTWAIDATTADAARARFTPPADDDTAAEA